MNFLSKKTVYEKRMNTALDKNQVVFYDYIRYKKAAGWWTGIDETDWNRPIKVKKAKYHGGFLQDLPDYYFLGFPIKELINANYSEGFCHACAVALSLYFDEFEIITCNLSNYVDYCNRVSYRRISQFEHSFIAVNINGVKTVIDTTWGIITDYKIYSYIFGVKNIRSISSEVLKETDVYQFIKNKKLYKGPSYGIETTSDDEYKKYHLMLEEYSCLCKNYSNINNHQLQDFIKRCLYGCSDRDCIAEWRSKQISSTTENKKISYPTVDLYSLTDDELDFNLESQYRDTIIRDEIVIESHKNQTLSEENATRDKILRLEKKINHDTIYP